MEAQEPDKAEKPRGYKVALIHNIIAPYRVPLFEGLSRYPSIDLHVYFCARTHRERQWEVLDRETYSYEVLPGMTLELRGIRNHINPAIITELIKKKYDVVIICGNTDFTTQAAFIISKLLRTPVILCTEIIESALSPLGKIVNRLLSFTIKMADAIVVVGTMSRDFSVNQGATPEKIFVAPNSVDNEFFFHTSSKYKKRKNKFKQELNIRNKRIILFVGRLIKIKGVEYLLEAYKKLKNEYCDVCLIIVGDGLLKDRLNEMCLYQDIKDVHFIGWVEEEKIIYYSIADLFVLPTLRDLWTLVINEAMCCGLPVISTTAAGCSVDMIFPGENGCIVNPADVNQLYKAIKAIIFNDELAQNMGQRSREIVNSNFNIGTAINGFVSAIEYACRNQRNVS